jgi:hypothetical protein
MFFKINNLFKVQIVTENDKFCLWINAEIAVKINCLFTKAERIPRILPEAASQISLLNRKVLEKEISPESIS